MPPKEASREKSNHTRRTKRSTTHRMSSPQADPSQAGTNRDSRARNPPNSNSVSRQNGTSSHRPNTSHNHPSPTYTTQAPSQHHTSPQTHSYQTREPHHSHQSTQSPRQDYNSRTTSQPHTSHTTYRPWARDNPALPPILSHPALQPTPYHPGTQPAQHPSWPLGYTNLQNLNRVRQPTSAMERLFREDERDGAFHAIGSVGPYLDEEDDDGGYEEGGRGEVYARYDVRYGYGYEGYEEEYEYDSRSSTAY